MLQLSDSPECCMGDMTFCGVSSTHQFHKCEFSMRFVVIVVCRSTIERFEHAICEAEASMRSNITFVMVLAIVRREGSTSVGRKCEFRFGFMTIGVF